MSLNSTPRTWTSGEVVTAAMLNAEIRDALTGIQAAWDDWTPTFTNLTQGNGLVVARYLRVGKTITYRINFTAGTTSSFPGGALLASLPVTMKSDYIAGSSALGSAVLYDSSVGVSSRTGGTAYVASVGSSAVGMLVGNAVVNDTSPWTWATGDTFAITGTYESA